MRLASYSPHAARRRAHHRLSHVASESLLEFRHVLHGPIDAPARERMFIGERSVTRCFVTLVLAPRSAICKEEALLCSEASGILLLARPGRLVQQPFERHIC